MELQERYKEGRIFTCAKTFFTLAGCGFWLHDMEEDEKKVEEEEEEEGTKNS